MNNGATALVVAFNARPIALAVKRIGLRVLAADYWGDVDLQGKVDGLATVIEQRPGEETEHPKGQVGDLLFDAAQRVVRDHGRPDLILLGSGLDDRPDLWEGLRRIAPIYGNDARALAVARNRVRLFDLARSLGISCPLTIEAHGVEECVRAADEIGYPVVVKPLAGSGGWGIDIAHDGRDVARLCRRRESALIQEYVRGTDASSSVLCDGDECRVVTVNEQLIGRRRLGTRRPFGYCGNVVPLEAPRGVVRAIREASRALGEALGLVGSNGIDWVVRPNGVPVLMEVNPRFQATLECIEMVTGTNLVEAHIEACRGELPGRDVETRGFAAKMIVFATSKGVVGDLTRVLDLHDIPRPGIVVSRGEPVCTVQTWGGSRAEAVERAWERVREVRRLVKPFRG